MATGQDFTTTTETRAIVAHGAFSAGQWALERVQLRDIAENELVVRIVASGICHTDLYFGEKKDGEEYALYPRVLGHEGSGYVERVGSKVTVAKPGDPVLLSFNYCNECAICRAGCPAHCLHFTHINFEGKPTFQLPGLGPPAEERPKIAGVFFGQSSFSNLTIVDEKAVVNVQGLISGPEDLKLLAPLGCGVQTGSGSITEIAAAQESDVVAIIGLGGVGLSGVMAAKLRNCRIIVGIDKYTSRLELAKELGATHTLDTSKMTSMNQLVDEVRAITDGVGSTITMEATGVPFLVEAGVEFTRYVGKILQVGIAPPGAQLELPIHPWMTSGKQYIGAAEGHAISKVYVPQMIQWWKEGKFPVEKLVKHFKVDEFDAAIRGMKTGEVIKPVIIW